MKTPQFPSPISHLPSPNVTDCWDKIGVIGGDRSCAELERYVHCRNCPVYAEAGAKLLDRALPPGYREEWTRRFAEAKTSAAVKKNSVVIFRIGQEWIALTSQALQEISEHRVIRSLPHQRNDFVLGLANVRGELLVCIAVEPLLGMASEKNRRENYSRLLVTGWQGSRLAFPVDEVFGVHRFLPQDMKETPATIAKSGGSFTRGLLNWEGRAVGVLDAELLFSTLNRSLA